MMYARLMWIIRVAACALVLAACADPGVSAGPEAVAKPSSPPPAKPATPAAAPPTTSAAPSASPAAASGGGGSHSEGGVAAEYTAELKRRIFAAWLLPAATSSAGISATGCLKLDQSGRVVERLVKPSCDAALDRSVEEALRHVERMDGPVPDGLLELLTVKGVCFRFSAS